MKPIHAVLCAALATSPWSLSLANPHTKDLTFRGPTTGINPKIVGGQEAQIGEFPWMVSLQDQYGDHFCGASLIADNYVLTAAHCVVGASANQVKVVLGVHSQQQSPEKQTLEVSRIIRHQQYDDFSLENDIALLQLKQAADQRFTRLQLADQQVMQQAATPGETATVIGWGTLQSDGPMPDALQKVDLPLVSPETCESAYYPGDIHSHNICAGYQQGGKDSCQGDSGGPLFVNHFNEFYQVGIVSWGEGCALPNKYGVYTRTESFGNWLTSAMSGQIGDDDSSPGDQPDPLPTPDNLTVIQDDSVHLSTQINLKEGETALAKIEVPNGVDYLLITTFGGTGDVDILVGRDYQPEDTADYMAMQDGNNEEIFISYPQAGTYNIVLAAYSMVQNTNLLVKYNNIPVQDDYPNDDIGNDSPGTDDDWGSDDTNGNDDWAGGDDDWNVNEDWNSGDDDWLADDDWGTGNDGNDDSWWNDDGFWGDDDSDFWTDEDDSLAGDDTMDDGWWDDWFNAWFG